MGLICHVFDLIGFVMCNVLFRHEIFCQRHEELGARLPVDLNQQIKISNLQKKKKVSIQKEIEFIRAITSQNE